VLFESVAAHYHDRASAGVLSGVESDGAGGTCIIKRFGGIVVTPDPGTAEYPGMPEAAIRTGTVDVVLPLGSIAPYLEKLFSENATP